MKIQNINADCNKKNISFGSKVDISDVYQYLSKQEHTELDRFETFLKNDGKNFDFNILFLNKNRILSRGYRTFQLNLLKADNGVQNSRIAGKYGLNFAELKRAYKKLIKEIKPGGTIYTPVRRFGGLF